MSEIKFSGFHDKNGKKIYEGDFVLCKGTHWGKQEPTELVGRVYYSDGKFYIRHNGGFGTANDCFSHFVDREIVGNIHDNPEPAKSLAS